MVLEKLNNVVRYYMVRVFTFQFLREKSKENSTSSNENKRFDQIGENVCIYDGFSQLLLHNCLETS